MTAVHGSLRVESAVPPRLHRAGPPRTFPRRDPLTRRAIIRAGLLLLIVTLFATPNVRLSGQETRSPARPIGLDVSLIATKRLAAAREFIDQGEWTAASEALEQLTRDYGDRMVEVEPGRFLNVAYGAEALLVQMPPPGLAEYRVRIDPIVQPIYERALERDDPSEMQRVASEGFASSFGDDALWWLAEEAWERGDLDAARARWTAMLPLPGEVDERPLVLRFPDTEFEMAQIRARLVLCSIMQGDQRQARRELEAFQTLHPSAQGKLAGREGDLAATLESIVSEVGSRGLTEARQPPQPTLTHVNWSVELPSARLPLIERARPGLPAVGPLAYSPVIWTDSVLTTNGRSVWAHRLADGSPTWPSSDAVEPGLIYSDRSADVSLDLPTAGVPRYTSCVSGGRYYARMGMPVVVQAQRSLRLPESRLICLDLAGAEGRLVWSATTNETLAAPGWTFSGAPLVQGDSLYVPLRRSAPQMGIGIACLSAQTGDLIWETTVCSDLQDRPATHHLVDEERLTLGNGLVYRHCGSGNVAAVDAVTGQVRWLTTHSSIPADPSEMSDEQQQRRAIPLFARGRLFLAPRNSHELLAVDAVSGVILWRRNEPGRIRDLIASSDGMLIAAGDQLLGARSGHRTRRVDGGFHRPSGFRIRSRRPRRRTRLLDDPMKNSSSSTGSRAPFAGGFRSRHWSMYPAATWRPEAERS